MFLGSCSKQPMDDIAQTVNQAAQKSANEKSSVARELVTSEEDYEKVFMALAATLDEETTMQITSVKGGGYIFTLLTQKPT